MSIENNFPIKYAILELKEEGGYLVNYKDIVRGYVVSKCYVVESSIKYRSNGDSQIFHKVIFPFKSLETLKLSLRNKGEYIGEKVIPQYDFDYNPYPVDIVSDLFDTYEDAKVQAQSQNEKLKHQIVSKIPYSVSDSKFKQALIDYEREFVEELSVCQLFEKLVLSNTEDMNITNETEENKGLQLLKGKI